MADSPPRRLLTRRNFLRLGAGVLAGAGLADVLWLEPHGVRVESLTLHTGQNGRPVRLVQISDLHLEELDGYILKVAALIAGLEPDLIVLTGDYLEEERNIRAVLEFLRRLKAPRGVYAVQGNWEYWSRLEGENLRRHFLGAGARLLINERADVEAGGQRLSLLGLDYPSSGDQLRALQELADPARFNLLLSHVPAFPHELLDRRIGLVLSGHTHGGQVRLPLLPPLYLPRFSGRFVAGLYRVGRHDTPLYVNRGIGTSVLPVRLACRPEITLITLTP
ncbi:MAG: metallophosphoesterase [Deltaproteobacteria bacterium]|nr:MAG: metallophosphoesterase [Deltaproteobacteria bacterium]